VFYALGQNAQDVEQRMKDDAVFAARYFNVHYTTSRGSQLRRFSTFVSSGAFGGTLATVGIVLVALATDPRTRNGERTLLAVACGFLVYGIILSGARTAMGCFVIGVALVLWFRRAVSQAIVWSVALAVVVKLAVDATYGNAAERFTTLFRLDEIVQRNIIPAWIGWNYMVDHPLGGGLGRSSHGVPFFLMTRMDREGFVQADGDLGRLMIELGIPGLVLFGWVMGVGLKTAFASVAATRNTPLLTAALANAACFLAAAMVIPTGSPFLGIPTGMLVWFLQGAMLRLRESDGSGLVTESAGSAAPEPGKPAKRFLYYRPPRPRPPSRRP
jgi:O-antigen ligase